MKILLYFYRIGTVINYMRWWSDFEKNQKKKSDPYRQNLEHFFTPTKCHWQKTHIFCHMFAKAGIHLSYKNLKRIFIRLPSKNYNNPSQFVFQLFHLGQYLLCKISKRQKSIYVTQWIMILEMYKAKIINCKNCSETVSDLLSLEHLTLHFL